MNCLLILLISGLFNILISFIFNDLLQTIIDSYPPPPLPVLPPYSNLSSEKLTADTWTINGYSANKTLPNGKEVKITQVSCNSFPYTTDACNTNMFFSHL